MRELSVEELELVSGGLGVPGAIVGGVTGVATYIGDAVAAGTDITTTGIIKSGLTSAVIGGLISPVAAKASKIGAAGIAFPSIGFYAGFGIGLFERSNEKQDGTNYNEDGCDYN